MSFRDFIDGLKESGRLTEVKQAVSKDFEAPIYAHKTKGPILFHDVGGSKAIMNLLGTREELGAMLGVSKEEIIQRLANITPCGEVVVVKDSPTKEVIVEENDVDLFKLPIMKHFERDGGEGYITAGIVVSEYEGEKNASIHRLMLIDKNRLAARLVPPRHTYVIHKKAAKEGKDCRSQSFSEQTPSSPTRARHAFRCLKNLSTRRLCAAHRSNCLNAQTE